MLTIRDLLDFSLLSQAAYVDYLNQQGNLLSLTDISNEMQSSSGSFTNLQTQQFLNIDANNIPLAEVGGYTILDQRSDTESNGVRS